MDLALSAHNQIHWTAAISCVDRLDFHSRRGRESSRETAGRALCPRAMSLFVPPRRAALAVALCLCLLEAAASADIISTVAGTGSASGTACATSATLGTSVCLNYPRGVLVDGASANLYIADSLNYKVRKLALSTGIISTIAGTGSAGTSGNGGPATSALLSYLHGLALDSSGAYLYISDAT